MMLRRAEADAKALTGHPAFDNFMTYLQGRIDEIDSETANLKRQLFSPAQFNFAEIAQLQSQVVRNDLVVATLREIMAWPAQVLAAATEESNHGR
jgi:hypothetical protein